MVLPGWALFEVVPVEEDQATELEVEPFPSFLLFLDFHRSELVTAFGWLHVNIHFASVTDHSNFFRLSTPT